MLFDHVDILEEQYNDMGDWLVSIEMTARQFDKLMKQHGFSDLIIDESSVS